MSADQLLAGAAVLAVLGLCALVERSGAGAVAQEQERWRTAPRARRATAEDADEHLFVG